MDGFEEVGLLHKEISKRFEQYVNGIVEVYGKYMSEKTLNKLRNIENYAKHVFIENTGQINAFSREEGVFFPLTAYFVMEQLRQFKEYGINKEHKLYDEDTIVINDNTFYDYINHVILTGSTVKDYYEDLLLHETMHFCGSGGAYAIKEGINEYLTRKLAKEKGYRISSCGYPKEVKLVKALEDIFGEEIINCLAFINDERDIENFVEEKLGRRGRIFFVSVFNAAENEFYNSYYKNISKYNGFEGVKQKALDYEKIDYGKVYKIIDEYKKEINKKVHKI